MEDITSIQGENRYLVIARNSNGMLQRIQTRLNPEPQFVGYIQPNQDYYPLIYGNGDEDSHYGAALASYSYEPELSDTTAPTAISFSFTSNPKSINQNSSLTVPIIDSESTIVGAEYFLGDSDPGQGNGATMGLSNIDNDSKTANATTVFGSDFPTGVYKVSVRAQDSAGNWSEPVSDYLVVYNPNGPKMTGKRTITPRLSTGDILPGLNTESQTDKAKFGFSVKYNNQGQVASNSDFQLSYSTGTKCNKPQQAVNCHELELNATSISWLTTQGLNNSTGIFQGIANLKTDGQTSIVPFRVTGIDGERLNPTSMDNFQVHIFAPGANPNTDEPQYKINSMPIDRGNIKITG